jgi:hypothetical protein
MLERGQVGGLDAARMLDGDFGDAQRAAQLERRLGRAREQLADAQSMISPDAGRELDPVAQAGRHAHQLFVEATRAKMAAARDGGPVVRPFGSASRAAAAVRAETVTCHDCIDVGATPEQSYLIHVDPDAPASVRLPVAEVTEADLAEFGRQAGVPYRAASSQETGRNVAYNQHPGVAALAARYAWEDERTLRAAHGGAEGLAVRTVPDAIVAAR